MSRRPATKFPCKPDNCYASRHLDGPEYQIYDLMRAFTDGGRKPFYASVHKLCNAANKSRSAVDATLARLEAAGWISKHDREAKRRTDGTLPTNTYDVLSHEQWIKNHPGQCPDYKYDPFDGSKVETDGDVPQNFWTRDTALARALRKTMGEGVADILTDEESEALSKHLATPGSQGEVTTPGTQRPVPVARERAIPGTQVTPFRVDEENHSRCTRKNPMETTPGKPTDTHTHLSHEPASPDAEQGVCVLTQEAAVAGYEFRPPTNKDKAGMVKLAEQHGSETFLRVGRLFVKSPELLKVNARTEAAWMFFVNGFPTLLGHLEREQKQTSERLTPERIAEINRVANARSESVWATPAEKAAKGPTAEEFLED